MLVSGMRSRTEDLSLQLGGVDHPTHCGDTIGRYSRTAGVLTNCVLIRGKIDTVNLVFSDIAV